MNSWCYLLTSRKKPGPGCGAGAYFGGKPDLCQRDLRGRGFVPARVFRTVLTDDGLERAGLDAGTDAPHEFEIVMQVVDGVEARAEDFVAAVEVAQVRPRVVPA